MKTSRQILAVVALAGGILGAQGADSFSADFEQSMPAGISVSRTGADPLTYGYKDSNFPGAGWVRAQAGSKGYAAVVCTFCIDPLTAGTTQQPDEASTRTMLLPAISVKPGAILRWQSKSMMGDFPESYRVEARQGDNVTVLFETGADSNAWKWNYVDLDEFAGSDIQIAFVSTTPSGFMLCVDDIFAGVPTDDKASVTLTSPVFEKREHVYVAGSFSNLGTAEGFAGIGVVIDGKLVGSQMFDNPAERDQEFDIQLQDLELNKKYTYSLVGLDKNLKQTVISTGNPLYISEFKRNHVLDKGTGLWCGTCPSGTVTVDQIMHTYPGQIIEVCDQARPDPDEIQVDPQYWTEIRFFSAPAFRLNHNLKNTSVDWNRVENDFFTPTIARVNIVKASHNPEAKSISLKYEIEFAEDIENVDDRYVLAYLYTRNIYDPTKLYSQLNTTTGAKNEQYYYLTKNVTPSLTKLNDVNSSTSVTAMDGLEGSVPASLAARTAWSNEIEIPVVDSVNEENGRLVVYLLDKQHPEGVNAAWTYAHTLLNADAMRLADMDGSENIGTGVDILPEAAPADAPAVYYDLQGRRVSNPGPGLYIERRGNVTTKVVRK